MNTGILKPLDRWVKRGGIFYAAAGLGHRNQFNEPEEGMLKLLGLKEVKTKKNAIIIRTLLELPHFPPIDTSNFEGSQIPAVGMRQALVPGKARVLGSWLDGSPAVTVHDIGKGKAFAVGTLAGNTYMKTGVRVQPRPRGGRKQVYNPDGFDPAAARLAHLGVNAREIPRESECSNPYVESQIIDNEGGTLVTLTNWTNGDIKGLKVTVKMKAKPGKVESITLGKELPSEYSEGKLTFSIDLNEGDFVKITK